MSVVLGEFAQIIGERLICRGYKAYIVGGYLRDLYLKREPLDIDLATNAKPHEIEKLFSDYYIYSVGKSFGTLGIYCKERNYAVEITTFRKDLQCNGRKPIVKFSNSINDDLERRDFTMNAIALDLETDGILDPFGGQRDISHKVIRTVGNADKRFQEDYLRMLRACRFMALDMDMSIAPETFNGIRRNARQIRRISAERLRMELIKGMKYPVPSNMIHTMKSTGLLKIVLPELQNAVGVEQNRYHCIYVCDECGEFYTIRGDGAELVPWKIDMRELDRESEFALLLQQHIVKI